MVHTSVIPVEAEAGGTEVQKFKLTPRGCNLSGTFGKKTKMRKRRGNKGGERGRREGRKEGKLCLGSVRPENSMGRGEMCSPCVAVVQYLCERLVVWLEMLGSPSAPDHTFKWFLQRLGTVIRDTDLSLSSLVSHAQANTCPGTSELYSDVCLHRSEFDFKPVFSAVRKSVTDHRHLELPAGTSICPTSHSSVSSRDLPLSVGPAQ